MKESVTFGTRGSVVCRGAKLEAEKVVDLNPDEAIGFFFNLPNPSSHTIALGLS
jgi:hypothetical protein